jgi:phospholipase C
MTPDPEQRSGGPLDGREGEERFAAEHPAEHLRRRDFIARTAALAGAAGVGAALPLDSLISAAATKQVRAPYPKPRDMPINHFVVLMMENRSFDHYFGWRSDVDGRNAGLKYPDDQGNLHPTHALAPDFQGCAFGDPDHSWDAGRVQYHHGKLDGFFKASDEYALGYYLKQDLGFIPQLAKAFTLYDRYFCSILAGTYPNRHYQWSAQCGGQTSNVIPAGSLGNKWETIFDRATAQGLSVRYYNSDLPFAALYGSRATSWIRPIAEYYDDAATGNLPNIAFVDPPFLDGGGGDGLSGDEHPHGDIRIGQFFMSEVVKAFLDSPNFRHGAMFVNYDEWGGFFDHVSPRFVPDDRRHKKLSKDFGVTGFRVPGVAISPYARRGHVSHTTVDHVSILKMISYRFGLGYLTKRHRYASDIGRTFDFSNPNYDVPALPSPLPPVTVPCSSQAKSPAGEAATRRAERDEGGSLGDIAEYAESLGIDVKPATPDRVFAHPGRAKELGELWRAAAKARART